MNTSDISITPKPDISDAREFMIRQVTTVFETMLSLKIAPAKDDQTPLLGERVTGTIGFGGERVKGVLYLDLPIAAANRLASIMLTQSPQAIAADRDVNDVVGEMTNMIAGGFKSWLINSGVPCAISIPAIIRGTFYQIEAPPDAECRRLVFECAPDVVAVEIHIQLA